MNNKMSSQQFYPKMSFLLQVFLLLLGADGSVDQSRTMELHGEFQGLVFLDCRKDTMLVRLTYDAIRFRMKMPLHLEGLLTGGNFSLGQEQSNRPCKSTNNKQAKEHQFLMKAGECNSAYYDMPYGKRLSVNLYIDINPPNVYTMTTYVYTVSCAFPEHKLTDSWYEVKVAGKPVNYTVNGTLHVPLYEQLRFIPRPSIPTWANELQTIHAYPSTCTVSTDSNAVTVLDNGCPLYGADGQVLSAIYQSTADLYFGHRAEIFLITIGQLFPDKLDEKEVEIAVECRVFFCTSRFLERVEGIPLCPSVSPCEARDGRQPLLKTGSALQFSTARLPYTFTVDMERAGHFKAEYKAVRLPEMPPLPEQCWFCMITLEVIAVVLILSFFIVVTLIVALFILHWSKKVPRHAAVTQATPDTEALCKTATA